MSTDTITRISEQSETDISEPKLYKVIFHNDDKTTMEFVVALLMMVFQKSTTEAELIMMEVHFKGQGVVGVYPYEIAEQKTHESVTMARGNGYPLKVTFEED